MDKEKIALLIPTFNAGDTWRDVLKSISDQSAPIAEKIIVDSGSTDDTVELARLFGFKVFNIGTHEFNHGATRQLLVNKSSADISVFLTQDAVLASVDSIKLLVNAFVDQQVGLAYGRQLPRPGATVLESHARIFNYPPISDVRTYNDKNRLKFKVFFCSNSFAAYRNELLNIVGGFPGDSIMGEDALVSAKMLSKGYKVAYVADATVYHSHNYTLTQEFKRYFDTRVFHEQNPWLIETYGKPSGEGIRFLKSELKHVIKHDLKSILKMVGSSGAKWLGYNAGRFYKKFPVSLLKKLSMHQFYWER